MGQQKENGMRGCETGMKQDAACWRETGMKPATYESSMSHLPLSVYKRTA